MKKCTFIQGLCKLELLILNISIFIWCAFTLLFQLMATVAMVTVNVVLLKIECYLNGGHEFTVQDEGDNKFKRHIF